MTRRGSGTMRTMRLLVLAAVLGLLPAMAHAQHTSTPTEVALARQQFDEGVQHAQAGQWDQAVALFQRSYDVAPRAVTLLNLAAAQVQTHHYVAATESYRRYLATASDRDLARYRAQAENALADAQTRIGQATVRAPGLLESDVVTVDGDALPRAAVGIAMPLDPGSHVATVRRHDAEIARRAFTVAEAGSANVSLDVPPPAPGDVARVDGEDHDAAGNAGGRETVPPPGDGGVLASPIFWVVVGVVIAAAIVVPIVLVTTAGSVEPFNGNTMPGMIVVP